MKPLRALSAVLVLAASVSTQSLLSCEISPNPATPGQGLTFAIQATTPGYLQSGCGINEIRMNSPTGPIVWQPFICPFLLILVGPGSSSYAFHSGTTAGGAAFAPGTYYAVINWNGTGGGAPLPSGVFPFRIDDPMAPPLPVLWSVGGLAGGQTATFTLTSPVDPGAFYIAAASMTTTTGWFLLGGQHVALDMGDPIFALSYPLPLPNVFGGFSGSLDASGFTSAISISIPVGVVATGNPGAIQAAIVDAMGNIKLANALTFSIQ